MMKNFILILFVFSLFSNKVFAETKEESRAKYVLSNMQQDYIVCYSFYKIGVEYIKKSNGDKKIIDGVEKSSDISLKLSYETGELMGMDTEEMSLKVKKEMKNQLGQIDNDFNNASILLKKYAKQCKLLLENKKQRIAFWKKKASLKFK
jgi:hypothetical protein